MGADRDRSPGRICFCGSIKWRERGRFGRGDLGELRNQVSRVPGADGETGLVGVSRSGFEPEADRGLGAAFTPDDLVAAWRSPLVGDDWPIAARAKDPSA
ncbi:MAG: hypothetical protein H0V53_05465 [Rubrobacter sp.]|nr:hypothetical protein [Rubrobacter sp.]